MRGAWRLIKKFAINCLIDIGDEILTSNATDFTLS